MMGRPKKKRYILVDKDEPFYIRMVYPVGYEYPVPIAEDYKEAATLFLEEAANKIIKKFNLSEYQIVKEEWKSW